VSKTMLLVSSFLFINMGVGAAQRNWQKSLTGRPSVHADCQNSGAVSFRDQKPEGTTETSFDTFWKMFLCLTPLKIVVAIMLHRQSQQQPLVIPKNVIEPAAVSFEKSFFSGPGSLWQAILICVAAACILALVGVMLQLSSPAAQSKVKVRAGPSRSRRSQRLTARNIRRHAVNVANLSTTTTTTASSSMSDDSACQEKVVHTINVANLPTTTTTASSSMSDDSACQEKIVHRPGAARRMRLLRRQQDNMDPRIVLVPRIEGSEQCRADCMTVSTEHLVNDGFPVAQESCTVYEVDGSAECAQAKLQCRIPFSEGQHPSESKHQFNEMLQMWASRDLGRNMEAPKGRQPGWIRSVSLS